MTGTHWPHPPVGTRPAPCESYTPSSVHSATSPCGTCGARRDAHGLSPDPMARPHVDVSIPVVGGSIRLHSASGGLESLWIHLRDEDGARVTLDHATGEHMAAPVRLTPKGARLVAEILIRYADSHTETPE